MDSDQEFNDISAFDLSQNLDPLQDQGIDPTRFEQFFQHEVYTAETRSFYYYTEWFGEADITNIRFFRKRWDCCPSGSAEFRWLVR